MLSVPYPAVLPVRAGQEGDCHAAGPAQPFPDLYLVPEEGEEAAAALTQAWLKMYSFVWWTFGTQSLARSPPPSPTTFHTPYTGWICSGSSPTHAPYRSQLHSWGEMEPLCCPCKWE